MAFLTLIFCALWTRLPNGQQLHRPTDPSDQANVNETNERTMTRITTTFGRNVNVKCDSSERKCLIIRWVCQIDSDNTNHTAISNQKEKMKTKKRTAGEIAREECVGKGNWKINKIMNERENVYRFSWLSAGRLCVCEGVSACATVRNDCFFTSIGNVTKIVCSLCIVCVAVVAVHKIKFNWKESIDGKQTKELIDTHRPTNTESDGESRLYLLLFGVRPAPYTGMQHWMDERRYRDDDVKRKHNTLYRSTYITVAHNCRYRFARRIETF